jgi:hypothetical protein
MVETLWGSQGRHNFEKMIFFGLSVIPDCCNSKSKLNWWPCLLIISL